MSVAVRSIRMCDACGKDESKNNKVLGIDIKRTDGVRTTGDLCQSCLGKMAEQYHLGHTSRQRRTPFKVVEFDEIPRQ